MMKWSFIALIGLLGFGCSNEPFAPVGDEYVIKAHWYQSYPDEQRDHIDTGLIWTFSFLGAELPAKSYTAATNWTGKQIEIDFSKLGFDLVVLPQIASILAEIKRSEEYEITQGIDIGRLVSTLLIESNHYYSITQVPKKLVLENEAFEDSCMIMQSSVSPHPRMILLPKSAVSPALRFLAKEGSFDSAKAIMIPEEFEVIDVMDNGQLRFSIYDKDHKRIAWANPELSFGGKPSKCLWCHETVLNPNFTNSTSHPNFLEVDKFNERIESEQQVLNERRQGCSTDIDFAQLQAHTYCELLYIGYYEPSLKRLAQEWGMSETDAARKLKNESTHPHAEFTFFESLYHRSDVEHLSPVQHVSTPLTTREPE
jgi:hypothetical protein